MNAIVTLSDLADFIVRHGVGISVRREGGQWVAVVSDGSEVVYVPGATLAEAIDGMCAVVEEAHRGRD